MSRIDYSRLHEIRYGAIAVPEAADEQVREKRVPLIEGRYMRCPRCEKQHDILMYVPLQQKEKFMLETNPIYKCPSCRWMFSPAAHALEIFV